MANAFLPITFVEADSPTKGKQGFAVLDWDLKAVSQRVLEKAESDGLATAVTDHSIPRIGAYMDHLVESVLQSKGAANGDPYVTRWHDALALTALCCLCSLPLTIRAMDLSHPMTPTEKVYKEELKRIGKKDATHEGLLDKSGKCYVLEADGYAYGVLHPELMVVPFKKIDKRLLAQLPWYDMDTESWLDIENDVNHKRLKATEKLQLAAWLRVQLPALCKDVQDVVEPWIARLERGLTQNPDGAPMRNPVGVGRENADGKKNADVDFSMIFGDVSLKKLFEVPNFEVPVMCRVFTNRVFFAPVNYIGAGCDLAMRTTNHDKVQVLPPIDKEFVSLLQEHAAEGNLVLQELSIVDNFTTKHEITIEMKVKNGDLEMHRRHVYRGSEIVQLQNMPYFAMWPFVNLPEEAWKAYSCYMVKNNVATPLEEGCTELDANRVGLTFNPVNPDNLPDVQVDVVHPQDGNETNNYTILTQPKYPELIPLSYKDPFTAENMQVGCIWVKRDEAAKPLAIPAGPISASVDFGTSNTVCLVKCMSSDTNKVLHGEYTRQLVAGEGVEESTVRDFHRYYGPSLSSKEYKFPSVLQAFMLGGKKLPVVNGRALLVESGVLERFTSEAQNRQKSLRSVGIFSDMKIQDNKEPDVEVAAEIYLRHIVLMCALEAKMMNGNAIQFHFSYPNNKYKNGLERKWNSATQYIAAQRIFAGEVSYDDLTECDASSYYVQAAKNMTKAAAPRVGFAIVDIGGGTSDMSVWREVDMRKDGTRVQPGEPGSVKKLAKLGSLSMKYAGNQLFSSSFYSYFAGNPVMHDRIDLLFDTSRLTDPTKIKNAKEGIANYKKALEKTRSTDDSLDMVNALLNSLIEATGIDRTALGDCEELQAMIYLKLKGIFYVLGRLICEYDGIDVESSGRYEIVLVGGGSQAYSNVNRNQFNQSVFSMLAEMTDVNPANMNRKFSIQPPENKNKTEVVAGMTGYKADFANNVAGLNKEGYTVLEHESLPSVALRDSVRRSSYINYVKRFVADDPALKKLLPYLQLETADVEMTAEIERNEVLYASVCENVWNEVRKSLDSNVPSSIRLGVYCVMVAEQMLLHAKFKTT